LCENRHRLSGDIDATAVQTPFQWASATPKLTMTVAARIVGGQAQRPAAKPANKE
jgi:hypothetical protein